MEIGKSGPGERKTTSPEPSSITSSSKNERHVSSSTGTPQAKSQLGNSPSSPTELKQRTAVVKSNTEANAKTNQPVAADAAYPAKLSKEQKKEFSTSVEKTNDFISQNYAKKLEIEHTRNLSTASAIKNFLDAIEVDNDKVSSEKKSNILKSLQIYLLKSIDGENRSSEIYESWEKLCRDNDFYSILQTLYESKTQRHLLERFLLTIPYEHALHLSTQYVSKKAPQTEEEIAFYKFLNETALANGRKEGLQPTTRNTLLIKALNAIQKKDNAFLQTTIDNVLKIIVSAGKGEPVRHIISTLLSETNKENFYAVLDQLQSNKLLYSFFAELSPEDVLKIVKDLPKYHADAALALGNRFNTVNKEAEAHYKDTIHQLMSIHQQNVSTVLSILDGARIEKTGKDQIFTFFQERDTYNSPETLHEWKILCEQPKAQLAFKELQKQGRLNELLRNAPVEYDILLLPIIPERQKEILTHFKSGKGDPIFSLGKLPLEACIDFCPILNQLNLKEHQLVQIVNNLFQKVENPEDLGILCLQGQFDMLLAKALNIKIPRIQTEMKKILEGIDLEKLLTVRQFLTGPALDSTILTKPLVRNSEALLGKDAQGETHLANIFGINIHLATALVKTILKAPNSLYSLENKNAILKEFIKLCSKHQDAWPFLCQDEEFVETLENQMQINKRNMLVDEGHYSMAIGLAQHSDFFKESITNPQSSNYSPIPPEKFISLSTRDVLNFSTLNPAAKEEILGKSIKTGTWNTFKNIIDAASAVIKTLFGFRTDVKIEASGTFERRFESIVNTSIRNPQAITDFLKEAVNGYIRREIPLSSLERLFKLGAQEIGFDTFHKNFGSEICNYLTQISSTPQELEQLGYTREDRSLQKVRQLIYKNALDHLNSHSFQSMMSKEGRAKIEADFLQGNLNIIPSTLDFLNESFANLNPQQILSCVKSYLIDLEEAHSGLAINSELSQVDLDNLGTLEDYLANYIDNNFKLSDSVEGKFGELKGFIKDIRERGHFENNDLQQLHQTAFGNIRPANRKDSKDTEAIELSKKAIQPDGWFSNHGKYFKKLELLLNKGEVSPHAFDQIQRNLLTYIQDPKNQNETRKKQAADLIARAIQLNLVTQSGYKELAGVMDTAAKLPKFLQFYNPIIRELRANKETSIG